MKTKNVITKCSCLRCQYEWYPQKPGMPTVCPSCHSPYWNKPRRGEATNKEE